MKKITAIFVATLTLSGCLATTKPFVNAQGESTEFTDPVLSTSMLDQAHYVLLEKSIASGN